MGKDIIQFSTIKAFMANHVSLHGWHASFSVPKTAYSSDFSLITSNVLAGMVSVLKFGKSRTDA